MEKIMEPAILILILVLCLCLVYVTELMKKMCDRMNWLQDQFNNFKDYNDKEFAEIMSQFISIKDDNAKKWAEYSKEYAEVMELLLAKHNEINELRDQLKLIEDRVEKYKDGTSDNLCTVYSRINALNSIVKKNEEDKVKVDEDCLYDEVFGIRARLDALEYKVNESKNYLCENLYEIYSRFDVLDSTIDECKKTLNEIRTEKSNKEGKEENE